MQLRVIVSHDLHTLFLTYYPSAQLVQVAAPPCSSQLSQFASIVLHKTHLSSAVTYAPTPQSVQCGSPFWSAQVVQLLSSVEHAMQVPLGAR
jgi:hypothetical protein